MPKREVVGQAKEHVQQDVSRKKPKRKSVGQAKQNAEDVSSKIPKRKSVGQAKRNAEGMSSKLRKRKRVNQAKQNVEDASRKILKRKSVGQAKQNAEDVSSKIPKRKSVGQPRAKQNAKDLSGKRKGVGLDKQNAKDLASKRKGLDRGKQNAKDQAPQLKENEIAFMTMKKKYWPVLIVKLFTCTALILKVNAARGTKPMRLRRKFLVPFNNSISMDYTIASYFWRKGCDDFRDAVWKARRYRVRCAMSVKVDPMRFLTYRARDEPSDTPQSSTSQEPNGTLPYQSRHEDSDSEGDYRVGTPALNVVEDLSEFQKDVPLTDEFLQFMAKMKSIMMSPSCLQYLQEIFRENIISSRQQLYYKSVNGDYLAHECLMHKSGAGPFTRLDMKNEDMENIIDLYVAEYRKLQKVPCDPEPVIPVHIIWFPEAMLFAYRLITHANVDEAEAWLKDSHWDAEQLASFERKVAKFEEQAERNRSKN